MAVSYSCDSANACSGVDIESRADHFLALGARAESPASLAAEPDTVSHVQAEVASASAQQSPSGVATPPPGQKWRTYYYAGGAQPIAVRETTNDGGNTLHYLHSDHLGSTSAVTCGNAAGCATAGGTVPNGGVVARQSYYPYGNVRSSTGTLPTDRTYTGQISDPSTGLMYSRARYYSPTIGRFLSADSIVPEPGSPQALNRYSYVNNRPINFNDPSGHDCQDGPDTWAACFGQSANTAVIRAANRRSSRNVITYSEVKNLQARVYYLNSIGMGAASNAPFLASSNPANEQGYYMYAAGLASGNSVTHIPVYYGDGFWGSTGWTRLQMLAEGYEWRVWSSQVADAIAGDLSANPLAPGERVVIIGSSGGGTVAVEALDLLQQHGVYVDQLILRGSYVREISLTNVGRVDYITSHFDHWYSFDVNPFDSVSVQEHVANFRGHVPPTAYNVAEIGDLIINLMVDYE